MKRSVSAVTLALVILVHVRRSASAMKRVLRRTVAGEVGDFFCLLLVVC